MKTITVTTVTVAFATGTLTSDNTNVSNGETVTINGTVYTFKTTLTPTEGEVLIGLTADASLLNLIHAINHTGEPDIEYSCAAANTYVRAATSVTAHAFAVTAKVSGTAGNAYTTTETSAHLSWGAATLATGADTITITGTVADATLTTPFTQITVPDFPTGNKRWSRNGKLSNQAMVLYRNESTGQTGSAIYLTSLSKVAYSLVPGLTYAPKITTQPSSASCVASSTAATFTVVDSSETTETYIWEYEAKSVGTLTSDNTNVSNNDTVTIGSTVYTFKTALTPTAGEVLIGANADASLLNLIRAINHSGTAGTDYANLGSTAVANTQVSAATSVTAHAFLVTSLTAGSAYNTVATTETSTHLSWGNTTLKSGGWTVATGTVNGCAFTNGTTASLTCTPTTTVMTLTSLRCNITNASGTTVTDEVILTIT